MLEPALAELGQLDEVAVRVWDRRHAHTADLLGLVQRLDAPSCQGLEVVVEVEDHEGQLDGADADVGIALEVLAWMNHKVNVAQLAAPVLQGLTVLLRP